MRFIFTIFYPKTLFSCRVRRLGGSSESRKPNYVPDLSESGVLRTGSDVHYSEPGSLVDDVFVDSLLRTFSWTRTVLPLLPGSTSWARHLRRTASHWGHTAEIGWQPHHAESRKASFNAAHSTRSPAAKLPCRDPWNRHLTKDQLSALCFERGRGREKVRDDGCEFVYAQAARTSGPAKIVTTPEPASTTRKGTSVTPSRRRRC
jgi:hypothetical protein